MFEKYWSRVPIKVVCCVDITKENKLLKVASSATNKDVDVNELIEKYKTTGVLDEMQKRPDTFLWVCARAIDADISNDNGDFFSKEELLKEVDLGEKKGKVPAYKTFEGVPIYTNHKNDDIEQAKGKVVYAEWDEKDNCVYCTFFVDSEAYPHLARAIKEGIAHDVSMGCNVAYSRCSVCDHKAFTEKEYCPHIKDYKGRKWSGVHGGRKYTDVLVYEKNFDIKFIELSVVSDGAYENCEIDHILPLEEMLNKATNIEKSATRIEKMAKEALADKELNSNDTTRNLIVDLINLNDEISKITKNKFDRFAYFTPETLQIFPEKISDVAEVGPQQTSDLTNQTTILPDVAELQNKVGEAMGAFDELTKLDWAQKYIESAIVDLIKNRHNVNMTNVSDLAKHLAGVQEVVGNLIDDGFKPTGMSGVNVQVTPQGELPQQAPQSISPQPTTPQPGVQQGFNPQQANEGTDYTQAGPVGIRMGQANSIKNKIGNFSEISRYKEKMKKSASSRKEKSSMENYVQMSEIVRDKYTDQTVEQFQKEKGDYRVVISSRGDIKGFYNNSEVEWMPSISDDQIEKLAHGEISYVTGQLLDQFKEACAEGRIKIASIKKETPSVPTEGRLQNSSTSDGMSARLGYPEETLENYVGNARKGEETELAENRLEKARSGVENIQIEKKFESDDATHWGHKGTNDLARETALEDLRANTELPTPEQRLDTQRAGTSSGKEVVASINRALAKAVVDAGASPIEILREASQIANIERLPEIIADFATKDNKKARDNYRERSQFNRQAGINLAKIADVSIKGHIVGCLADEASETITPKDISDALQHVAKIDQAKYSNIIGKLAKEIMPEVKVSATSKVNRTSDIKEAFINTVASIESSESSLTKESVKATIVAMTRTLEDAKITDDEIISHASNLPIDNLFGRIEIGRNKENSEKREATRKRAEFWNSKFANVENIDELFIGHLSDAANELNVKTAEIVNTLSYLMQKKSATKKLINTSLRRAARITDSSTREFRVCFTLGEAGTSKEDPNKENQIKVFVNDILTKQGYSIADPDSLTFTDLNISSSGDVCGVIRSQVQSELCTDNIAEGPIAIVTTAYKKNQHLQRTAQMAPQAPAGGMEMPNAGGLAGNPGADPAAGAVGGNPGLSAITGGGEPAAEDDEMTPEDSIPEPGKIEMPGKICPSCGSKNVSCTEGNCKCSDCSYEYTVELIIKGTLPDEGGEDLEEEESGLAGLDELTEEEPVAPEAMAPEVTAPTTPGMMPPQQGGPVQQPMASNKKRTVVANKMPIVVKLAWNADPDDFIRTAILHETNTEPHIGEPLAIGHVCPQCGEKKRIERVAKKDVTEMYCDNCGNIAVAKTKPNGKTIHCELAYLI